MRVLLGRMSEREPWWAEFWSAVAAILWCGAAAVLSSGPDGMPSFKLITTIAPVWLWYLFSVVVPLAQILALRQDHRLARLIVGALMSWWWMFLTLSVAVGAPTAPGLALYAVFCLVNLHSLWRLRPHSDNPARNG